MKKRRSLLGIAGALVATVAITGSAFAATLFANGTFENGPAGTTTLTTGSTDISGWKVTGTNIDYLNSYWQSADSDGRSLDLNGDRPGGIEQTFATKVDSMYVVQFSMSGNPGDCVAFPQGLCSDALKTMTVQATGGSPVTYSYDTATSGNDFVNMKWVTPSAYAFKATSTETTLSFVSTTGGSFGPALDNVVITETLATGASCKKGGWESMVDKTGTHFRNQGDCVSYWATGEKNLAF